MRPLFHRHYRPLFLLKTSHSPSSLFPISSPNTFSLYNFSYFFLSITKIIDQLLILIIKFLQKMAQRTEKEETEFKAVPETITLCVNNCGVTGNPATNNMCQKCFNATTAASTSSSPTGSTVTMPHKFARSEKSGRFSSLRYSPAPARNSDLERTTSQDLKRNVEESGVTAPVKREVNRCSGCRRKVGLTGFRCRCGELFCGEHRYSDRHDCSFDYKSAGRDAIARENPVVKAAKIVKL